MIKRIVLVSQKFDSNAFATSPNNTAYLIAKSLDAVQKFKTEFENQGYNITSENLTAGKFTAEKTEEDN